MPLRNLSSEQIREVLTRAEEIQYQPEGPAELSPELRSVISAAEEAGLSREAVMQALRERLGLLGEPPQVGELVFAKSTDDKFYAAEILDTQGRNIKLEFLSGGEHRLPLEDLRPLAIMPGQKLVCPWPMWGWWTCTVLDFDAKNRRVRVTDNWGSEESFSIADVHMVPQRERSATQSSIRTKLAWIMLSCAGIGAAIGGLVTWLFMR